LVFPSKHINFTCNCLLRSIETLAKKKKVLIHQYNEVQKGKHDNGFITT